MASSKERFTELGEADIKKSLEEKDSKNTKKNNKGKQSNSYRVSARKET